MGGERIFEKEVKSKLLLTIFSVSTMGIILSAIGYAANRDSLFLVILVICFVIDLVSLILMKRKKIRWEDIPDMISAKKSRRR